MSSNPADHDQPSGDSANPTLIDAASGVIRVLVIDDDELDFLHVSRLLGQARGSFQVHWAQTYTEGLAGLLTGSYDVFLVDYMLGSHTGAGLLREAIHRDFRGPAVMLTGHDGPLVDEEALKAGACGFISKDGLDAPALARAIVYAIERNRTLRELQSAQSQSRHQALHDPLTGLGNRTLLDVRLEHALACLRRDPQAVITLLDIDIDGLKDVNDALGQNGGDQVLIETGNRLRRSIRDVDTACRLGSDEFAVLLTNVVKVEDGHQIATSLVAELLRPFVIDRRMLPLSASIGVYRCEDGKTALADVMARANSAMYQAKRAGKARFACYGDEPAPQPSRDPAGQTLAEIADELRRPKGGSTWEPASTVRAFRAPVESPEGFIINYDPIFDLETGRRVGLHAQPTWPSSNDNAGNRAEHLAARDRSTSQRVLERICADIKSWMMAPTSTTPPPVIFRPSIRHFYEAAFATNLARALGSSSLGPHAILIEITESAIFSDLAVALQALTSLRRQGISFVIGEFNGQRLPLPTLISLPAVQLRIDPRLCLMRSREVAVPHPLALDDERSIRAYTGLAHGLSCTLVYDAVTNQSDVDKLRAFGVDQAQGAYFGPPVVAAEIGRILANESPALLLRA